jgi:hypothetical protein
MVGISIDRYFDTNLVIKPGNVAKLLLVPCAFYWEETGGM